MSMLQCNCISTAMHLVQYHVGFYLEIEPDDDDDDDAAKA
jgi:hypothetical protein